MPTPSTMIILRHTTQEGMPLNHSAFDSIQDAEKWLEENNYVKNGVRSYFLSRVPPGKPMVPIYVSVLYARIENPERQIIFQMTEARRKSNEEWPNWMHVAWNKDRDELWSIYPKDFPDSNGTDHIMINTPGGPVVVEWGDWLVKIGGGIYIVSEQEALP